MMFVCQSVPIFGRFFQGFPEWKIVNHQDFLREYAHGVNKLQAGLADRRIESAEPVEDYCLLDTPQLL